MNTRIKELAQKSGMTWADDCECWFPEIKYPFGYDKFAELIVRDVISMIAKHKDNAIENDWNVDEAMTITEQDILEHFGVKL